MLGIIWQGPPMNIVNVVSSPDPTLARREKDLVTLGKKLGPVDDPQRNLRLPIRSQL